MSSGRSQSVFCPLTIDEGAARLRAGGLVAFGTETVYGLGADATNPVAVAGIFEVKQRPSFDPLIVHLGDADAVGSVCRRFPPLAARLAEAFWPGPLTMVLPKRECISDLVTAGLPGVGVRVPGSESARRLLNLTGRPVAAPSANPFGGISPTTALDVWQAFGAEIDGIVDAGPCSVGIESTVLSLMDDVPMLLRPGGCPLEDIERIVGRVRRVTADPTRENQSQLAPGMLSRHYAPQTRLETISVDAVAHPVPGRRTGLLTDAFRERGAGFAAVRVLSTDGSLRTSAAAFFAALRSLDSEALDVIIAHRFPDTGLGIALNDRLCRAAAR